MPKNKNFHRDKPAINSSVGIDSEICFAREYRDFEAINLRYADDRMNKVFDSLTEKELQIAALVFVIATAFLGRGGLLLPPFSLVFL